MGRTSANEEQTDAASFVFVGGLHRSGTSLVAELLAGADGAAGLTGTGFTEDEGHYLHDVVPSALELGGPGRFAFDQTAHLGPSSSPAIERQRLLDAWAPFWSDPLASIRIEKSPQNLVQTQWLQSLWVDARFVIVTRHPAAVALATMKWTRPGPPKLRRVMPRMSMEQLIGHWCHAHHLFELDRPLLDWVEVVRFEDVIDPDSDRLEQIGQALGLAGPIERPQLRATSDTYDRQWRAWRESRSGRRAATTWLPMAEAAMTRWGYSLNDRLV